MIGIWLRAALVVVLSSSAAAESAEWQKQLAALALPDAHPTIGTLGAVLAPLGGAKIASDCTTMPGHVLGGAPAITAISINAVVSCLDAAPVIRVQLLLQPVNAAEVASLRRALQLGAGRPCFDGIYPAGSRRRAPPLHFLAWSGPGRDMVVTQDNSVPDGVSITFLRNDLQVADAQAMAAYAELRDTAHRVLPPSCQSTR